MINKNKWINSLPQNTLKINETINYLDEDRWLKTISKKDKYSSAKKNSLLGVFFILGLILVSLVKNETRTLQKEINNLQASVEIIRFNLNQATLDNEVITSPENISFLAKQYLNSDLTFYKRSQIKSLKYNHNTFYDLKKITKKEKDNFKNKIEEKTKDISKLKTLYKQPKLIPGKIKKHVGSKIKKKKVS